LFIVDKEGILVQHFSKKEGLQNNNVLSLKIDKLGNIWTGLDNGIDCIAYNSAIKKILPNDQNGSGYAAVIHKKQLYLGTSSGVYRTSLQNMQDLSFSVGEFTPVINTNGQVWNLTEINDKLLLGHHEGAFIIEEDRAQPLLNKTGFWNFTPLSNVFPASNIIAGNYKGIQYFNFQNNSFSPSIPIPDFNETSRFVAVDINGNFWVSHPYHGIYRISKSNNGNFRSELYDDKKGLPMTINNHIYTVRNQVIAATEKGIYKYNATTNNFEPDQFYTNLLGKQSIRYIKEDKKGNLWFIHEKSLGVIDFSAKKPKVILLENLHKKMLSGFEFIYPIDQHNVLLGAEEGFYHINYDKYKNNIAPPKVSISSVKIINQKDSIIFGGYYQYINSPEKQEENAIPEINDDWKDIHFEFAVPGMPNDADILYSFRLKGLENEWSDWSGKTEKDYTNLSPGDYTFEVKVKNNFGKESSVSQFKFTILPPFYRSPIAFIFYLLLFCVSIFLINRQQKQKFKLQQSKYEEEQKRLQYLHQLEIDKAESELITLRNEKLQSEIDFKNSELATNAMHLVQKGEILSKIKTELNQIIKSIDNEKTIAELKKMVKALGEDEKMDSDWDHFTQHFDKVHSDFVVVLKEVHPNITANEIKICTYLRMNLSTKEIAQLMNISVRGVEISRYRLRKKLGISTETNLFDYLISLTGKNNN
jgi:DNA-binding CsgD family transcriptional regulator